MDADATALWGATGAGGESLRLSSAAVAVPVPGKGLGRAQAEQPLVRGESFTVRLLQSDLGTAGPCSAAVGLAPRGGRRTGRLGGEEGTYAYGSGSLAEGV